MSLLDKYKEEISTPSLEAFDYTFELLDIQTELKAALEQSDFDTDELEVSNEGLIDGIKNITKSIGKWVDNVKQNSEDYVNITQTDNKPRNDKIAEYGNILSELEKKIKEMEGNNRVTIDLYSVSNIFYNLPNKNWNTDFPLLLKKQKELNDYLFKEYLDKILKNHTTLLSIVKKGKGDNKDDFLKSLKEVNKLPTPGSLLDTKFTKQDGRPGNIHLSTVDRNPYVRLLGNPLNIKGNKNNSRIKIGLDEIKLIHSETKKLLDDLEVFNNLDFVSKYKKFIEEFNSKAFSEVYKLSGDLGVVKGGDHEVRQLATISFATLRVMEAAIFGNIYATLVNIAGFISVMKKYFIEVR